MVRVVEVVLEGGGRKITRGGGGERVGRKKEGGVGEEGIQERE